ncbi:hypothetical protein MKJ04_09155 [Pontibacter sp. E15-1]|nr:hypothetical protein [Pontibacter sp. E15-1]MCJ8165010.1 hypothetical protein [Pontibacter sp. E15-1]
MAQEARAATLGHTKQNGHGHNPNQRIKEPEARLAQAQERASQAELKAKFLYTLIDVAEGEFGFQIRKKPLPK